MPTKYDGFKDFVLDQLTDLRGLVCRAMFGGYGLYQGTTFFGIIHKGRLYFKVTPTTATTYKKQGMKPFRPNSKQTLKSFYEVPVEIIEDTEQLADWAEQSVKG
ncbi:MAG: TfoX/Sxy family protein [Nitrospiraceae bacterium]